MTDNLLSRLEELEREVEALEALTADPWRQAVRAELDEIRAANLDDDTTTSEED